VKSILTLIDELDNGNYYKIENYNIVNWNDKTEHQNFIKKFFMSSGKESIINDFDFDIENFERATHTNSVYFLGILLYQKLNFERQIKFKREGREGDEFYFIWFLTSLAHDFGYMIEDNTDRYKCITNNIETFKRHFNIENDLLEKFRITPKSSFAKDDSGLLHLIEKYSPYMIKLIEYIETYYTDRFDGKEGRTNKSKIDHGIASGIILFDRLVKNRKINDESNTNDLYWGSYLDDFYETASQAIAVHNIRMKSQEKFSQNDNPFSFLFRLVDTIEPTKYFSCKPKYVLENIMIEFNSSGSSFTIENKEDSNLDFSKYIKDIKNLETFLKIKIEDTENKITLFW